MIHLIMLGDKNEVIPVGV